MQGCLEVVWGALKTEVGSTPERNFPQGPLWMLRYHTDILMLCMLYLELLYLGFCSFPWGD